MYEDILEKTDHRHTPLPDGKWLLTQRWDHLLFMHLPVHPPTMESLIPDGLELDTYEKRAWLTIIPFKVNGMHVRKMPPIPFYRPFLELNVRTYVKHEGRPGIYFFSLDASKLLAVLGARTVTLPYYYADMKMKQKSGTFYYRCKRKGEKEYEFRGSYRPVSEPYHPEAGSLSSWLLERYYQWSVRGNGLYEVGIHHRPWKVQDVDVTIGTSEMAPFIPKRSIVGSPLFHYAYSKRVLFWPVKRTGTKAGD